MGYIEHRKAEKVRMDDGRFCTSMVTNLRDLKRNTIKENQKLQGGSPPYTEFFRCELEDLDELETYINDIILPRRSKISRQKLSDIEKLIKDEINFKLLYIRHEEPSDPDYEETDAVRFLNALRKKNIKVEWACSEYIIPGAVDVFKCFDSIMAAARVARVNKSIESTGNNKLKFEFWIN